MPAGDDSASFACLDVFHSDNAYAQCKSDEACENIDEGGKDSGPNASPPGSHGDECSRRASIIPVCMKTSLALLFMISSSGCIQEAVKEAIRPEPNPFAYDRAAPLAAQVAEPTRSRGFTSIKFSIQGSRERVPGILTIPDSITEKPAVLLLLHGMGGRKEELLAVAAMASAAGYATVAIDAPLHGERKVDSKAIIDPDARLTRQHWIDAIVDWRRAIDYLQTRSDIDSKRLIILGTSMGGMMGSMLAGADDRVSAAAILIAGGDWMTLFKGSSHKSVAIFRDKTDAEVSALVEQYMADIDPVKWISKVAPRPVLFINGSKDDIIPMASAEALINAAKEPKDVYWDAVGHTVSPMRLATILDWIKGHTPTS
jgi:dipeptidyl aminopeptidase/acylaminoacyl peptidase